MLLSSDTTVGSGDSPNPSDKVEVHFTVKFKETGALIDGTRKDAADTYRTGKPISFKIDNGDVIKGWNEGMKTMRVGGTRSLSIPSDIGYGVSGGINGKIPPNTQIVMEVELLGIQKESITEKLGVDDVLPSYPPQVRAAVEEGSSVL